MIKMLKDPVFNLALLLSLALHIFWLSAVKIVVTPEGVRAVKFSRVSFLGPISERSALDVGIGPPERSFPEKRYLSDIKSGPFSRTSAMGFWDVPNKDADISREAMLIDFIEEAVSDPKLEPIRPAE